MTQVSSYISAFTCILEVHSYAEQHWLYEAEQMLWHLQTDNQLSRAIIIFPRRQSRVFQQVLFKSLWQQWHELIKKTTSLMPFP